MAWQDDVQGEASIGGAPFLYRSIKASKGRRTVVTEFPDRDFPGTEDMGRAARRWIVDAVVAGPEYLRARDALVEVLEKRGPHTFSNPYEGDFYVVLDGRVDITESVEEGGAARISFTVVESGAEENLLIVPSSAAALNAAAATVIDAADAHAVAAAKQGVLSAVAGAINKAATAIGKVHSKTRALMHSADDLTFAILDLQDAANALATNPLAGLNALLGALAGFIRTSNDADAVEFPGGEKALRVDTALQSVSELTETSLETTPVYPGQPVDEEEAAAERAIQRSFHAAAVANFASLFAELALESTADADKIVDVLGAAIDSLQGDAETPDEVFTALSDLRAALSSQVNTATANLPSLGEFVPALSMPSLLVAFFVHGDPLREPEIVARNRVPHPCFVPGGKPLKVLA